MTKPNTSGWIKLHRQLIDHWIFEDAIKLKCWMDILFTVNAEDKKVNIGLQMFDCKRGQSLHSIQTWATRWRMSKSAARSLLNLLQTEKMITHESIGKSTRLTVCKYDDYQYVAHDKKPDGNRKAHTTKEDIIINNNIVLTHLEKTFADYLEMRVKIKKPATQRAIELVNLKLEKYSEGDEAIKIQILEQSITSGWQDIFPLKPETFKQQKINGVTVVDQSGNKNLFKV